MRNFLDRMEAKFGRFAIPNLMRYICVMYVAGLIINVVKPEFYYYYLSLNPVMVMRGQVWRLFTFLIQTPNSNVIFFLFTLYLYYMIGSILEKNWGAFRFNVYYFSGVIFTIIGSFALYFATGRAYLMDTYYINMSLFLAFAFVFPDMKLLFMFIIPMKIKWLAYLDLALFAYEFFMGSMATRVEIFVSLLNFVIFYFAFMKVRRSPKQIYRQQAYKRAVHKPASTITRHKCAICGKTEAVDPDMEFRFCSKCNGNYEYCSEHLFTHTHVQ